MAEIELRAGAKLDLLSPREFNDGLSKALDAANAQQEARLRGIKAVRLPLVQGKAVAGVLALGGDNANPVGPGSGYVWSIRHLVVEGLTSGQTPDVVNILRSGLRALWQLNGNQFAQTWGRGELLLFAGETLSYASAGTFTATGTILVHGLAEEAPAQLAGKFYA